jgi:hypothetical protein
MNSYMAKVGQKVSQARTKLVVPGQRDGVNGFNFTASRLINSARNLCFSMDGGDFYEPTDALYKGFSDAPGMNDVKNAYGVDVVDISIMATMQSVLPYLAAERAMDKPKDIVYYQKLISRNAAGGFAKGADVVNPFKPISNDINLGVANGGTTSAVTGAAGANITVTAGTGIAKGSVIIKAYADAAARTAGTVLAYGKDLESDGNIYWTKGGSAASASVDYAEGEVVIVQGATATVIYDVSYELERTGEEDGANTLKTKPVTESTIITAKNNRIVLESSFEDQACNSYLLVA